MTVQFLSLEWVEAYNEALGSAPLERGDVPSILADGGRFSVAQTVRDAPPDAGLITTVLWVEENRAHLEVAPDETSGRAMADAADVVVSLAYADATALSQGTLDTADAVSRGLVQVRGDLSLLIASHAMLAAAAERLAGLTGRTSY